MSQNEPKIKVACVGAGYFSRFHYDAWHRIEDVELVGSCNRNVQLAEQTGLSPFGDLETMLHATKPDLLDIITPPETHLDFIKKALDCGVKYIICQKPFCNNIEEAKEAINAAKAAEALIIVHENFRFQPWYRAMKTALDDELVGVVHQLTFRMRTGDGQGPDAYMERQPYFQKMEKFLVHETGVHWVDTFRFLLGNPIAVYADLRKLNPAIAGEDAGYFIFDYQNNVRALWDANRHIDHPSEDHRLTFGECLIEGTKGVLELLGDGSLTFRNFNQNSKETILPAKKWQGFAGDCVFELQSHVIDAIRGERAFENTAEEYLTVLEIEDAIYQSNEIKSRIVL